MTNFEDIMHQGGSTAIANATRFFMKDDPVHRALREITSRLNKLGIAYAVAGGMSLVVHGYDRTTVDVDILVTPKGLEAIHEHLDGLGYVPPFKGSKHLRDTATGVRIEFLVSGQFPGDGKPKPVSFPDPAQASTVIDGICYLKLEKLVELKLASGMTNAGRVKDLGDVQELVRALNLPRTFSDKLDPSVRDKFIELWSAVQPTGDE